MPKLSIDAAISLFFIRLHGVKKDNFIFYYYLLLICLRTDASSLLIDTCSDNLSDPKDTRLLFVVSVVGIGIVT